MQRTIRNLLKRVTRQVTFCFWIAAFAGNTVALTVPEGPEHATDVLGRSWAMSSQAEVFPLLWAHNLSSATVADGVLTGVARDTDPHFWLQFPPIPSAIEPANLAQTAIDASTYTRLSVMMWLPDTVVPGSRNGRLVWHKGGSTVQSFDAAYSESTLFPVYPGWRLYDFDMPNLGILSGTDWRGTLQGLRIDPCLGCNVTFKIDWARLYKNEPQVVIPASGLPVGASRLIVNVPPMGGASTVPTVLPVSGNTLYAGRLPAGRYAYATVSDVDYALSQRGKAWAFDQKTDALWASNSGLAQATVSANGLSAVTQNADPFVLLDIPAQAPIDATKYRYLAVDLTVNAIPSQESGLLAWWGSAPATVAYPSAFVPLRAGRNTYNVDLGTNPNWRGLIKALRIDPLNGPNAGASVPFTLHGVRLTSQPNVQEQVVWATDQLVVNGRPGVQVVSPSYESGDDYALVETGKPWQMLAGQVQQPQLSNLSGWETVNQIAELGVTGTFFHATSKVAAAGHTEGDPQVFLSYQNNTHPIDAGQYSWLGFDLYVPIDATQQSELTRGAVARLSWKSSDTDPGVTSDDIVLRPGLQRYWFDMRKLVYEPASSRTWSGLVPYLRVDPFEFPESRHFYMGPAQLRSLVTAKYVVPVALQLSDLEGDHLQVSIKSGQTVLASVAGVSPGRYEIYANVGSLPAGEHSLTVEVSDGYSILRKTASVPIVKLDSTTPMPDGQKKSADRIFNWAEAVMGSALGAAGTSSELNPACASAIPGAYGRTYPSTATCLFSVDGLIVYSRGGASLTVAGSNSQLIQAAVAAGH